MLQACPIGIAVSPAPAEFAPLLYAGRLRDAVRAAAELGLDCIELSVRDPGQIAVPEVQQMLRAAGVRVSAVATGQACLADGLCLGAQEETVRTAALERFRGQAALAAELGAAIVLGGVRGRLGTTSTAERDRRREIMVAAIAACVELAEEAGAPIVLEPLNRYETDFVHTVREGLLLIDELRLSALRLLLDSFHMNIEESQLAAAIHSAGSRIGYVHLADSNRLAPGLGHIDFAAVLGALENVGYSGPIVAEILPFPDDETAARRAADFLRRAVAAAPTGSLVLQSPR